MEKKFFITGIGIEKFRNLENIVIKLDNNERRHLIITGKNGSGKTSLVRGIYDKFSTSKTSFDLRIGRGISLYHNLDNNSIPDFMVREFSAQNILKVDIPKTITGVDVTASRTKYDDQSRKIVQYMINIRSEQLEAKRLGKTRTP
ncbi:hypothetical protein AGMMS49975_29660 [Clostridia bacterium]|nr:hypothetical protein AGMMS49975_29660 [Clostridia bacterium]